MNTPWLLVALSASCVFLSAFRAKAEIVVNTTKPGKAVAWQTTPSRTVTEYALDQTRLGTIVVKNARGVRSMTVSITAGAKEHSFTRAGQQAGGKKRPYPVELSLFLTALELDKSPDHPGTIDARRPLIVHVRAVIADGQTEDITYTFLALTASLNPTAGNQPPGLSLSAKNAQTIYLFADTTQVQEYSPNGTPFGETLSTSSSNVIYYFFADALHALAPTVGAGGCPPDDPLILCRSAVVSSGGPPPPPPAGTFNLPVTFQFDNSMSVNHTPIADAGFLATGEWSPNPPLYPFPIAGATSFVCYVPASPVDKHQTQRIPNDTRNDLVPTVGPLSYGTWTISFTGTPGAGSGTCVSKYQQGMGQPSTVSAIAGGLPTQACD